MAEAESRPSPLLRVLLAGGGIAGLEAVLALGDMGESRLELTLAAPEPEFQLMAIDPRS